MIFYLVSIFLIGLILPASLVVFSNDDDLAKSPFVLALNQAKIPGVDGFMNFICLVSVLSAGNSSMYGFVLIF
jgi:amino acid transporter